MTHFGPWIRQLARSIEGGRDAGNTWNVLYHRIGTGDSGAYKVINAGNTEAIRREVLPFEWRVSNANKLLMNVVDMTTLNAKVLKALNEGKLEAFGNDLGQFHSDFQKYLANHRANLPGENGIGIERRNIINGLLSPGTKLNRGANPLTGDFGPRGIIRTIRMDRLEDASPALGPDGQPKTGFHFDYDKVNANRMPDVKPYPGMEPDNLASRNAQEEATAIQPRGGAEHQKAVQAAISVLQGGKEGSFHRPDQGLIHVMAGSDGDARKSYENGSGMNGIIVKRMVRGQDAAEAVAGATTAAAIGRKVREIGGPQGRIEYQHNGYTAILSLTHHGDQKSWVLSGYKKGDVASKESYNPNRYAPQGSGCRQAVVASSIQKLLRELQ